MSIRTATMVTRRCIRFLPFNCSTERLHQGLSRQEASRNKIRNSNIEIRNKTQPNKSKPEQFQNEESESRLFGTLCFLVILNLFRASSFEFRAFSLDHLKLFRIPSFEFVNSGLWLGILLGLAPDQRFGMTL